MNREFLGEGGQPGARVAARVSAHSTPAQSRSEARLVSSSSLWQLADMEIVFSIAQEADGGFVAECLSQDIFTQGDTWDELRANVKEAVTAYFFDPPKPTAIRLHLVRDEVLAVA